MRKLKGFRGSGETCRSAIGIGWLLLQLSRFEKRRSTFPVVLMDVIQLASKFGIGHMDRDFRTGSGAMSGRAADFVHVQAVIHEMGQHQMPQLVWGQLGSAERISDLIEDFGHGPFADRLAGIGVGFGKKKRASILGSIRFDQAGPIEVQVILQDSPGRV
jgi:hypothetical protein